MLLLGSNFATDGGGKRIRTADPLLAKQVLYQLSHTPLDIRMYMIKLARFSLERVSYTTELHP